MEYSFALMSILLVGMFVVGEIKEARKFARTAPAGKVFIKKFHEVVTDIQRAQAYAKTAGFVSTVNGHTFNVSVEKDDVPKGLEYETIPLHKSYCAYINEEPVCRVHILHVNCKDKVYLEFSSKRKCAEIAEIIEGAHQAAKDAIKKYYKDNGIAIPDKTSFYSFTNG